MIMTIEETMFREYDIRGRVDDKELNDNSIKLIAKAFATVLQKKGIGECVVGHDCRDYSPGLHNMFIDELTCNGLDVIDLGMVLTPMTYFSQYHYNVKACAMITASHNPNGWCGLKLGYDFSKTLGPEEIKELLNIIKKSEYIENDKKGLIRKENITPYYTKDLLKKVSMQKKLNVVINCGNGTAGPIVPSIFSKAGCNVIPQFCNIDTAFPNHEPNPASVEMMEALGKEVVKQGADIGIAFDGDGDRLGVCNERGEVVWPDNVLILLSRLVLEKHPGAKIIYDVKCTQALEEDIIKHGGIPIMWKTGHAHIKAKLHQEKALLAGERSGHIFFADGYYGFDDAVFSGLKLLEYISKQNASFSDIMKGVSRYYQSPTYHVDCDDRVKYQIVDKLTKEFKEDFKNVIDINGARVVFDDGWGLVRASSNLPVLVLVFEAKTKARLESIQELFRERLSRYPEIGKEWFTG